MEGMDWNGLPHLSGMGGPVSGGPGVRLSTEVLPRRNCA